jgi:hypothetical protein
MSRDLKEAPKSSLLTPYIHFFTSMWSQGGSIDQRSRRRLPSSSFQDILLMVLFLLSSLFFWDRFLPSLGCHSIFFYRSPLARGWFSWIRSMQGGNHASLSSLLCLPRPFSFLFFFFFFFFFFRRREGNPYFFLKLRASRKAWVRGRVRCIPSPKLRRLSPI